MATSHPMTLGGSKLRVNPQEVLWNFNLTTGDTKSLGGKVIQITGLEISDITVSGVFSPDANLNEQEAWEAEMRFRERIKLMARGTAGTAGDKAQPIRFTYPPRNWDFDVFIKAYSPTKLDLTTVAAKWTLTLFPVGAGSRSVVDGIKDLYIKRLMDGIGWKQTAYNGPMTQDEVDSALGGQSIPEYLAQGYGEAASRGAEGQFGPVGP